MAEQKELQDQSNPTDKLKEKASERLENALTLLGRFNLDSNALNKSERNRAEQYHEGKLLQLKNYQTNEHETNIEEKLEIAERSIKPTTTERIYSKFLHDLTHAGEFLAVVFACIALLFNPVFGIFALMTGIASIVEIIAGAVEWKKSNKRIMIKETARQAVEQLVLALQAYYEHPDINKNRKLYLGGAIACWEARLQRDELNLKRLPTERWGARAAVTSGIIALTLILTTNVNIVLLLLCMVVVDKLIHAIFALMKTRWAKDEFKAIQSLKEFSDTLENKKDICHECIKKRFDETEERGSKREWKQWVHIIALSCAILSLVTASLVTASLSISPLTIIILISTAMAIEGGTKFFWFIYHFLRFKNKKNNQKKENIGEHLHSKIKPEEDNNVNNPLPKHSFSFFRACPQAKKTLHDNQRNQASDNIQSDLTLMT